MKKLIEVDNQGNVLSKDQLDYFKNSKVRENGKLMVCYHGSPNRSFNEFNPKSSNSQFGKYKFSTNVNYFTTDLPSAESYTEFGYEDVDNVYYVYINIENPYILNNESLADIKTSFNIKDSKLRKQQIQAFDTVFNKWESYFNSQYDEITPELVDEINDDLSILNVEIRQNDGDDEIFDLYYLGNNSFFGSEYSIFDYYYLDELFSDDMYDEFRENVIGEDDDYYLSTDLIVKCVLYMNKTQGTNYDGIIIDDIVDSKQPFSASGTDVITLKSSNQIKSTGNIHPTSTNSIDGSTDIKIRNL